MVPTTKPYLNYVKTQLRAIKLSIAELFAKATIHQA
jgi:hypothetical protein